MGETSGIEIDGICVFDEKIDKDGVALMVGVQGDFAYSLRVRSIVKTSPVIWLCLCQMHEVTQVGAQGKVG